MVFGRLHWSFVVCVCVFGSHVFGGRALHFNTTLCAVKLLYFSEQYCCCCRLAHAGLWLYILHISRLKSKLRVNLCKFVTYISYFIVNFVPGYD